MATLHVCFGSRGECQNCGGFTTAEGGDFVAGVWVPDGTRGPFEGDDRFCSEECFAEAQDFARRVKAMTSSSWCPACGYDKHEHAEGCPDG